MTPTLQVLYFILLVTGGNAHSRCRRTFKLTEEFCANIPTTKVNLQAFAGTWFQIFLTVDTNPMQINKCTTANYTLQPDNTFNGLNCEFESSLPRPRCLATKISRRADRGPGSFFVSTGFSSANFNIIALLGSKSFGHFGAAAFQCSAEVPRTPEYFILARKPFLQKTVLRLLKRKVRCAGFPLPSKEEFKKTQVRGCKYFFNKDGFDRLN